MRRLPVQLERTFAGQATQQDVEHRREKEAEHGHPDHAGKDRLSNKLPIFVDWVGELFARHDLMQRRATRAA